MWFSLYYLYVLLSSCVSPPPSTEDKGIREFLRPRERNVCSSFLQQRRHRSNAGQPPALASELPGLVVCSQKACNEHRGKARKCQSTDGELWCNHRERSRGRRREGRNPILNKYSEAEEWRLAVYQSETEERITQIFSFEVMWLDFAGTAACPYFSPWNHTSTYTTFSFFFITTVCYEIHIYID